MKTANSIPFFPQQPSVANPAIEVGRTERTRQTVTVLGEPRLGGDASPYPSRKRPPARRRDLLATRNLMRALSEFNPFAL
jgi:hypothetical protein